MGAIFEAKEEAKAEKLAAAQSARPHTAEPAPSAAGRSAHDRAQPADGSKTALVIEPGTTSAPPRSKAPIFPDKPEEEQEEQDEEADEQMDEEKGWGRGARE